MSHNIRTGSSLYFSSGNKFRICNLLVFSILLFVFLTEVSFCAQAMGTGELAEDRQIYVMIGCPGAGKSTLARKLFEKGYVQISPSNLLRDELRKASQLGLMYRKQIESGEPGIPSEVIVELLKTKVTSLLAEDSFSRLIIDGFPRSVEQAEALKEILVPYGLSDSMEAIYLEIDREKATCRLLSRRECNDCHRGYNLLFDPPTRESTCDSCEGMLSQRSNDIETQIKIRLDRFYVWSPDVLDYFRSREQLKILSQ
jgi:adenylate kinase